MDEEFDWSDFWKDDIVEDNEGEDSGEGAIDEDGKVGSEAAETETIDSANSENADFDSKESDVAIQEANTNDIQESEAEQEEYGTPVDLSWIGTSDLSKEEKTDTDDPFASFTNEKGEKLGSKVESKADTKEAATKTGTAKEEASQYPNGMTKEEFNAMYEYALGMTGRGGNQQLDDYGDPIGFWGDFETIPLTIEDTQQEIKDLQAQYDTLESRGTLSETVANNIQAEIEKNESMVAQAQEQLDTLNAFIDNYASLYTPIEKDEQKNPAAEKLAVAEKEYEKAYQAQNTAYANLTSALQKAGMDYNLSAEEILEMKGNKFELPKENKTYASRAAEAIVKNLSQRGFKGGDFVIPVDPAAKEKGNYLVKVAPAAGIGVSNYKVGIISPNGEFIAKGNVVAPSGWNNGTWDLKDKNGKTIASGESTSAFTQSVSKVLSNAAVADYENSKSTSSVPDEVINAAKAVLGAQNNLAEKEEKMEAARKEEVKATHTSATESKQDIMDKYARGEINAYQAAVALSNINDSMLDLNYDRITSAINYDNFKDASKIAGSTGKGTVGITSLASDLSPAGRDNPASATNISKDITMEFKNLNELKNSLTQVDTSTAKDLQSFNDLKAKVEDINTQLDKLASSTFLDLAKELLGKGIDLAELDKQPEMQQLNNEIYAIAQTVLDKASELKEISGQYGLNNLTMKELKENRDAYSAQVALITGKSGVELLDKSDMKALVKYSKSLDATIDSAKALMTAAAVLHGAQDVPGGKYAQAWKAEKVETKMTAKDWLSTAASSTADLLATVLGFGMVAVNPLVGGALAYAGTKGLVEQAGRTAGKKAQATLTNYERMFGSQNNKAASTISAVYDRGFNKANFGDVKSVGTYTTIAGATIDALNALALMTNPVTAVAGLGYLYKAGKTMTVDLSKGSYSGKKNNLITNVWRLVENIEEWADTNLDSQQLADLINAGATVDTFDIEGRTERREGEVARSDYGAEDAETREDADSTFSGYVEEAKNKNVAKDYNAGMEQEANEAVSDKYAKVFKVMIDKEPDYIRKVLIAIPKMHSEREW